MIYEPNDREDMFFRYEQFTPDVYVTWLIHERHFYIRRHLSIEEFVTPKSWEFG